MTTKNNTTTENTTANANENEKAEKVEKVAIKNATENTLFKDTLEFSNLSAIHTAFIDSVGKKKMSELKGQTTIGNIFCLSSGYVGNKLGTSPNFEKVISVYSELFNAKHEDSDEEKAAKSLKKLGISYSALPEKVRNAITEAVFNAY